MHGPVDDTPSHPATLFPLSHSPASLDLTHTLPTPPSHRMPGEVPASQGAPCPTPVHDTPPPSPLSALPPPSHPLPPTPLSPYARCAHHLSIKLVIHTRQDAHQAGLARTVGPQHTNLGTKVHACTAGEQQQPGGTRRNKCTSRKVAPNTPSSLGCANHVPLWSPPSPRVQ